ncbi:hypothetical protein GL279_14235 [Paracoccus limosus]|uniref:SF3 helicase domain-containing protein n=1 Tax=Paracoccus limosus TaxID=913252 RepID=A0A844H8S5_9RHOB|nr:phage/plasmid primase, P4 family [Paracoccus limosus]MTH35761.1 hypothetical protein [Paracoccus limosus]
MEGINLNDHFDLSDLLSDSPTENAAPAGTRNGVETAVAEKSNLLKDSALDAIGQGWDAMAASPRWVAWREDQRNGKPVKVPYCGPQRMARANDPATWMPKGRAEVLASALLSEGQRGGVGLMLGDGIGGVDLDSCYDDLNGLAPWAAEVIDRFASYAEISPSGTGVKVYFRYAPDDLEAARAIMGTQHGKSWSRGSHHEIALHLGNRYFAFTGQGLPASPADMRLVDRAALEWLIQNAGPRFKGDAPSPVIAAKDESRSGRAFRLAGQCKRAGESFEQFAAACHSDAALTEWAKDDRQLRRAWERARDLPAVDLADFDDLPGAIVTDFAVDEIPDLSHDQLALDLGRDGFDANARYVGELGGWLLWEGTRWQASPGMRPMSIVRDYVRAKATALMRWAEASAKARRLDDEATKELITATRAKAKAMRQDPFIAAVERLARSNHCSLSRPENWDADDMLLGTPGGTVDLRTGELRPADRRNYITKNTSVAPAAQGEAPTAWLQFLSEVFPNDPDMPRFIQRLAGYALTGSTREHRLFLFHGSGRNGKGTLLNTLQDIMGDYAKGVPTSALLETRGTQHASPIARLRGARLVRGAELPVGQTWNESLIKQLTGGDTITANLMRQDSFEFTPKFTLIIDGNTKPRIRTTDVAMKARMTLVPFTASFVGREDRGLPDRLKEEAGAILRWMIDGAVAWHREGLGIPAAVEAASTAYLAAEDVLADFVADEITQDLGCKVTVKDLYQRYLTWCDQERSKPMAKNTFSEAMVERGHVRRPGAKNWPTFYGIALRDGFDECPEVGEAT